jgi:hypothetical protein
MLSQSDSFERSLPRRRSLPGAGERPLECRHVAVTDLVQGDQIGRVGADLLERERVLQREVYVPGIVRVGAVAGEPDLVRDLVEAAHLRPGPASTGCRIGRRRPS